MIDVRSVQKWFGDFHALGPISFASHSERLISVIGPSGCGKSTLLRLLAGLEKPSEGSLRFAGENYDRPRKEINVVFQEPRLMPWLDVWDNVALGIWDLPPGQQREAVANAIHKVSLERFAHAFPKQLSGGMAQRVGLARAIVGSPSLLLLDEPFSALDPLTRIRMQDHLLKIIGPEGPRVLLITHDIEEALVLSDRILVIQGPPAQIRRDLAVDLPYPRDRTSEALQGFKKLLLQDLVPEQRDGNET